VVGYSCAADNYCRVVIYECVFLGSSICAYYISYVSLFV
jgi:hypothetical protein